MKLPRMEFGTLDFERTLERLTGKVGSGGASEAERMDCRGRRCRGVRVLGREHREARERRRVKQPLCIG